MSYRIRLLPLLITCVATLSVVAAPAPSDDPDKWRVVVQDSTVMPLAANQDATLVAGAAGAGPHVLQIIDVKTPHVVLNLPLPDAITSIAFAPDAKRLVVATRHGIWMVTLADGRAQEILPGVVGAIALNADGNLLGVLGTITDGKSSNEPDGLERAQALGVYDLKAKSWLAKTDTPILIQGIVTFDGDALFGYGLGGHVFNRVSSSFECDVRLNSKTGEAKQSRGVEKQARDPGDGFGDPKYKKPKCVGVAQAAVEDTKKIGATFLEKLSPTGNREFYRAQFAGVAFKDSVLFSVHRFVDRPALAAAVTVRQDGTIEIGKGVEAYEGVWPTGGTLGCPVYAPSSSPIVDVVTGKTLYDIPKTKDKQDVARALLKNGALALNNGSVSFFEPRSEKQVWSVSATELGDHTVRLSAAGDKIALHFPKDNKLIGGIYQSKNGKQICELSRPDGITENYAYSMAFNPKGNRFVVLIGGHMLEYDADTGKLLDDELLDVKSYDNQVTGLKDGWLVSGFAGARIRDAKGKWSKLWPVPEVNHVEEIAAPVGTRLLVETRDGHGYIIDPSDGHVQSRWFGGGDHSARERPPDAVVAFDGRLLVRSVGWAGAVELNDLSELKTVLTIHPLPVGDKLGWVAYTPDGFWDSSDGADRFIQVFNSGKAMEDSKKERRNAKMIRERLQAVCKSKP